MCHVLITGHQTSQAFTEAHRGRWGRRQPTEFSPSHLVDLLVCVFNNTQPTPGFNFSAEAFKELLSQFTAETFPCGRERRRKGRDDDSSDSDDRDHSTFPPMAYSQLVLSMVKDKGTMETYNHLKAVLE